MSDKLNNLNDAMNVFEAAETALTEALANAVLNGVPVKQCADVLKVGANTVATRLAKSGRFDAHLVNGKVTAASIVRAQYDAEREAAAESDDVQGETEQAA